MFYFAIKEDTVLNGICEEREALELSLQVNGFSDYEILTTDLDIDNNIDNRYIFDFDKKEWINNPNYESEQELKERERIQELSMTRGDLFEALILAQGIGKAQLRTMIENFKGLTDLERALYLNRFDEALDFYRKHPAIDLVGGLLGITPENMDKFFDTKDYTYLQVKTNEEIG